MAYAPLISIVTPCRNAAAFLPRALDSVVRSADRIAPGDLEHIIMDGGSTDGSVDLIRRHAEAHPRLVAHWSSQVDEGQSHAINRGMGVATGRFATWLNADDWLEPEGLAAVAARLREEPPDVLVGRCRFVDECGRVVWEPRPPEEITLAYLLSVRSRWFAGESLVQPEVFFRRELFERIGGLNSANHYTMDHELWCRMVLEGARFECIDALVANAGSHAGQKTRDNRAVVRQMLSYAVPMAQKHQGKLGEGAGRIAGELQAMATKLATADAIIRWWRRAVEMPDSERYPLPYERQPVPPPQGDRVRARAARAAAAALRWRRQLRIAFYECDPHVVAQVVRALGSRRTIELHLASGSKLAISQSAAAVRPLLGERSSIAGHREALVAGPFDLVVVQSLSVRAFAPVSTLGGLWARLEPRGVLLQLDDPVMDAEGGGGVRAYLEALTRELGHNLSKNDDVVLSADADAWVMEVARHPDTMAPAGFSMNEIIPRLSEGAVCCFQRSYGRAGDHPLTPFRALGPPDTRAFRSWSSSVWQRPR